MGQGAKREIRTFKLFTVLFWFSNYIVTPYITPYLQSLGAGNIVIGYVVSSYSIAQILVRVPLGIASDRMGRRKSFIVAGAVLTLVSVTGLWLTRSVAWVFVFRTLQGLAVTSWVCATVLFAGYLRPEEAVGATVQLQVCNSGGTLVGYLLGGLVAKRFGYGSVFLVAASGAALALAVSARIAERPRESGLWGQRRCCGLGLPLFCCLWRAWQCSGKSFCRPPPGASRRRSPPVLGRTPPASRPVRCAFRWPACWRRSW